MRAHSEDEHTVRVAQSTSAMRCMGAEPTGCDAHARYARRGGERACLRGTTGGRSCEHTVRRGACGERRSRSDVSRASGEHSLTTHTPKFTIRVKESKAADG